MLWESTVNKHNSSWMSPRKVQGHQDFKSQWNQKWAVCDSEAVDCRAVWKWVWILTSPHSKICKSEQATSPFYTPNHLSPGSSEDSHKCYCKSVWDNVCKVLWQSWFTTVTSFRILPHMGKEKKMEIPGLRYLKVEVL